jgi:hypothetical protein
MLSKVKLKVFTMILTLKSSCWIGLWMKICIYHRYRPEVMRIAIRVAVWRSAIVRMRPILKKPKCEWSDSLGKQTPSIFRRNITQSITSMSRTAAPTIMQAMIINEQWYAFCIFDAIK